MSDKWKTLGLLQNLGSAMGDALYNSQKIRSMRQNRAAQAQQMEHEDWMQQRRKEMAPLQQREAQARTEGVELQQDLRAINSGAAGEGMLARQQRLMKGLPSAKGIVSPGGQMSGSGRMEPGSPDYDPRQKRGMVQYEYQWVPSAEFKPGMGKVKALATFDEAEAAKRGVAPGQYAYVPKLDKQVTHRPNGSVQTLQSRRVRGYPMEPSVGDQGPGLTQEEMVAKGNQGLDRLGAAIDAPTRANMANEQRTYERRMEDRKAKVSEMTARTGAGHLQFEKSEAGVRRKMQALQNEAEAATQQLKVAGDADAQQIALDTLQDIQRRMAALTGAEGPAVRQPRVPSMDELQGLAADFLDDPEGLLEKAAAAGKIPQMMEQLRMAGIPEARLRQYAPDAAMSNAERMQARLQEIAAQEAEKARIQAKSEADRASYSTGQMRPGPGGRWYRSSK